MVQIRVNPVPAFQTEARDYTLQLSNDAFPRGISFNECIGRMYRIFEGVIDDLLGHLPDHAHARFILMPDRENDPDQGNLQQPVSASFQRVRLITPELIMAKIEKISQSKKSFVLNNKMRVHIIYTIPPAGNGRKSDCIQIKDKRSVFSVCGYTNNCLGSL